MNNDESQSPEQDECCIVWQPTLRTIYTREDIAELVGAIKAHDIAKSVSTAA
jgi:hypothetical protein